MADTSAAIASAGNRPIVGVAWLTFGLIAFSLHDAALKSLSGAYPLGQIMLAHSAVAFPIMLAMVYVDVGLGALADRRIGLLLLRACLLVTGYLCYYLGFAAMSMSDAVALYCTVPLIVVVLAGPMLGEKVGAVRWLAAATGFAGVLVMMRPGTGVFEPAGLLIIVCALLYSIGMIMARGMAGEVSTAVMSFYNNLVYLAVAPALAVFVGVGGIAAEEHASLAFLTRPWVWPPLGDLFIMSSCGVSGALGIIGLTAGYRNAEANLVASFEYTYLVWATLLGFLIFAEVPTPTTIAGAALIVAGGLVALWSGQAQAAARSER
jgi:drug/metabolite transporter (DMT)-like permease